MQSRILNAFLLQIVDQALFAIIAYEELGKALKIADVTRIYYCCQSFLVATANISKILWPDKKYRQRGDALRNLLQIDISSPLYSRDVRNDFEHIDDRIEEWAATNHPYVDGNVGPISTSNPEAIMRGFDTDKFAVTFRGKVYEIRPALQAVKDLLERTENELSKSLYGGHLTFRKRPGPLIF